MPQNSEKEDNNSSQHVKHHEEGSSPSQHDKHHEEHPLQPHEDAQEKIPKSKSKAGHLSSSSCPKTTAEAFISEGAFGIEFCSGTAGLTAQLRLHRLPASFGVDHKIEAGAKAPVCKLDLSEGPGCNTLNANTYTLEYHVVLAAVLMESAPRPLRSEAKPDGPDDLVPKKLNEYDWPMQFIPQLADSSYVLKPTRSSGL